MLLGTTPNHDNSPGAENLVIQLILQQRYAEVYELLQASTAPQTAANYNMALCLHWSGNYKEALNRLESIQLAPPLNNGNKLATNNGYKEIKNKQNQTDDYLNGLSEIYLKSFPALAHDAIVRLKTDCWLQLGEYAKVIAIATPIVHKGYKNITDALELAQAHHDKRI